MSCKNSDMPINVESTNNKCDLNCNFSYTYGSSDLSVSNNDEYLSFSYDGKAKVLFNGDNYSVQDIRLYKPSLNSYYGSKVDAELFIHHISATGQNLLLCIPIKENSAASASKTTFNNIIPFIPSKSGETQTININNYTLNHFIPKSGFYSYKGNLPYKPCNGDYNIILFDSNTSINMESKDLSTIASVLKTLNTNAKKANSTKLQYNSKGTQHSSTNGEDEIYIDCQPINGDGDLGEVQTNTTEKNTSSNIKVPSLERNMKYVEIIGGIAGGLLLFHFLTKGVKKLYNNLQ